MRGRENRFDVLEYFWVDDNCSNDRVKQLVSKKSGKRIVGLRPITFSSLIANGLDIVNIF